MKQDWFEELKAKMESPEGIAKMKNYFEKIKIRDEIYNKRLENFHEKMVNVKIFNKFVTKVIDKYDSDEYYYRWMCQHIEPPRDLEYFLHDYAVKYGEQIRDGVYKIYQWTFEIIQGQGCFVRITNLNE